MDRAFDALLFAVALVHGLDALFHVPGIALEDQSAVLTVHRRAVAGPLRPDPVFPGDATGGEIIADRHGVGGFLSVVVEELAASRNDARWRIQTEEPAEPVEG